MDDYPDSVLALLKQAEAKGRSSRFQFSLLIAEAEHYFIASSECGPYFTYAYHTKNPKRSAFRRYTQFNI